MRRLIFAAALAATPALAQDMPLPGCKINCTFLGATTLSGNSPTVFPAVTASSTLEGTIFYGQSNAGEGGSGTPAATAYGADCPTALMFAQNPIVTNTPVASTAMGGSAALQSIPYAASFAPMVSAGCAIQQVYANNSLASVPRWFGTTWYGGQPISAFQSGTPTYANLIAQTTAFSAMRPDLAPTRKVNDIVWIQGESGPADNTYQGALSTLITSLQTDVKAATAQAAVPDILIWQPNVASNAGAFALSSTYVPIADTAVVSSSVMVLGPTYFSPLDTTDNIHDTQLGRMMMADIHALAYKRIFNDGLSWNPLQPTTVGRVGAVITVQFQLPPGGGNLAFDATWIAATADKGFLFSDSNGIGTISSVVLGGDGTSVVITLSGTPSGTGKTLYYAMGPANAGDNASGWASTRGQLVSPTTSQSIFYALGYVVPQFVKHYAVRFGVSVP